MNRATSGFNLMLDAQGRGYCDALSPQRTLPNREKFTRTNRITSIKRASLMRKLDRHTFAAMLDEPINSLHESTVSLFDSLNFNYRHIHGDELERLIWTIIKRIDEDTQVVGAPERKIKWEDGWRENLDAYKASNHCVTSLTPKFLRPGQPLRLNQTYISPEDPLFELNFLTVLRNWIAHKYLVDVKNVYEFGCGTGHNLVAIAQLFEHKSLFGSDFVETAVQLINSISEARQLNIKGSVFDMTNPNKDYKIRPDSAVLTFGALEQLAGNVQPMIDYLLASRPTICIHIEPSEDLYDQVNLSDYLAYKFQSKRGYTGGHRSRFLGMQQRGLIRILKLRRISFGSMMMEGYNVFVWEPRS